MITRRKLLRISTALVGVVSMSRMANGQLLQMGVGGSSNGIPPLPLRQVASRGRISSNLLTATAQAMSKSFHFNRTGQNITSLGVRLPNWYGLQSQTSNNETAQGGPCTFQVSVEYPIGGTRQLLTIGGQSTFTAADNTDTDTDIVNLTTPIPAGAAFQIWVYRSGMTNMVYWSSRWNGTVPDDQMQTGASVANVTLTGALTSSTGSPGYGPSAIFSRMNTKAAFLWGDSRCMGTGDVADASGDIGELARSVGNSTTGIPYINAGVGSTKISTFLTGVNSKRLSLANTFCTGEACNYGVNDLGANETAATIEADLIAGHALFSPANKFQTTVYCASTSTNQWTAVDGSDQTTQTYNPARLTLNAAVKAGLSGLTGSFDSTSAVALGGDDTVGKFNANGTPDAWTTDGLHTTQLGYLAIMNLGAINPALF